MKSPIKKIFKRWWPAMALVLILLICGIGHGIYHAVQHNAYDMSTYAITDFSQSQSSFDTVAVEMLEIFEKEKTERPNLKRLVIKLNSLDQWTVLAYTDFGNVLAYSTSAESSAEARAAYNEVYQCFERALGADYTIENDAMSTVQVTEDRVVFRSGEAKYAIVYMKNGSTPRYLSDPSVTFEAFYPRRLYFKWFEVAYR